MQDFLNEPDRWRAYIAARVKPNGDCLEWQSARTQGYGLLCVKRRGVKANYRAHRAAWAIEKGEDPGKRYILHLCDNRACVNPKHLYAGSHDDNMRDMCERHPRFTHPDKWARARRLREQGYTYKRIAEALGMKRPTIAAHFRPKRKRKEYDG